MMRNELIDKSNPDVPDENRIETVLQRSKDVSLQRYERPVYNTESGRGPGGWYPLLVKTPALFNNEQFAVFRAVHEWRDKIARADDDSTAFVMPNHVIFSIAKLVPTDQVALLGIARPVSHSVKSRAGELLNVIKAAKAKTGPSMIDVLRPDSLGATAKANIPGLAAKSKVPSSEPLVAVVDDSDLRSANSTFWGGAFGSSIWDESTPSKPGRELRLAVPLPQLSPHIFESQADPFSQQRPAPATTLPIQSSKPVPKPDEPFVLKRSGKRKSEAISDPESEEGEAEAEAETSEYDISFTGPSDPTPEFSSKEKKKLKKQQKKESKPVAEDEEEPFDYSKAESVLHAKRGGGGEGKKKGKKQKDKPFDPYSKSENAAKGMRRAQTERAGKSHTFIN